MKRVNESFDLFWPSCTSALCYKQGGGGWSFQTINQQWRSSLVVALILPRVRNTMTDISRCHNLLSSSVRPLSPAGLDFPAALRTSSEIVIRLLSGPFPNWQLSCCQGCADGRMGQFGLIRLMAASAWRFLSGQQILMIHEQCQPVFLCIQSIFIYEHGIV